MTEVYPNINIIVKMKTTAKPVFLLSNDKNQTSNSSYLDI